MFTRPSPPPIQDRSLSLSRAWLDWFTQLFVLGGSVQTNTITIESTKVETSFDDRNGVDVDGKIDAALLIDRTPATRDYQPAIEEALIQSVPPAGRDFSGEIDELRRIVAGSSDAPQLTNLGSAAYTSSTDYDAAGAAAAVLATSLQKAANLSDLASAATGRTNLGLGTAATQNMATFGACTLAGTFNLGSQSFAGSALGGISFLRPATFAANGAQWSFSIQNAAAGDVMLLGQSGSAYTASGAISWIGNSNVFLYFNTGQDFRIGAGTSATPALMVKGSNRNVLIASTTDNGTDQLQVTGSVNVSTQVKTSALTTGVRTVSAADTATTSDHTIICNTTAAFTETLPASPLTGLTLYILNVGTFTLTINGNGKNIWSNGSLVASITISPTGTTTIQYDGTQWRQLNTGSDWVSWTPTVTCSGAMTATGLTITDAQYFRTGALVFFKLQVTATLGGALDKTVIFSPPITIVGQSSTFSCAVHQALGTWAAAFGLLDNVGQGIRVTPTNETNYAAGSTVFLAEGFYRA